MLNGWTMDIRLNSEDGDLGGKKIMGNRWEQLKQAELKPIYCEAVVLRGSAMISMISLSPSTFPIFVVTHLLSLLLDLLSLTTH